MSHGMEVNSKKCSTSAENPVNSLNIRGLDDYLAWRMLRVLTSRIMFLYIQCILLCTCGQVEAELAGSHRIVFRERKTIDLADARNTKSQNGQWDIFRISSGANNSPPRKRSGDLPGLPPQKIRKTFFLCTLQAHAIKTGWLRVPPLSTAKSIPQVPEESYFNSISESYCLGCASRRPGILAWRVSSFTINQTGCLQKYTVFIINNRQHDLLLSNPL